MNGQKSEVIFGHSKNRLRAFDLEHTFVSLILKRNNPFFENKKIYVFLKRVRGNGSMIKKETTSKGGFHRPGKKS